MWNYGAAAWISEKTLMLFQEKSYMRGWKNWKYPMNGGLWCIGCKNKLMPKSESRKAYPTVSALIWESSKVAPSLPPSWGYILTIWESG
jgi:hypothetical protein